MPTAPEHFLLIRLSSIGDIIHALPAASALAEAHPQAEITWAVESRYALLLAGNPSVHKRILIDTIGWRERIFSKRMFSELAAAASAIRAIRYDAVIDFQGLIKTGFISWLARSPRRIGYGRSPHREPGAGIFYTEEVPLRAGMHAIEENLALAGRLGAQAGAWKFPLPSREEDERSVEARLSAFGAKEVIIVNPGGGWMAKRWAPANYASLLKRMPQAMPAPMYRAERVPAIVLTGSPSEEKSIAAILSHSGCSGARYFASTLGEYIALARRARLFIGGDTGPMHIASALGVPVVAIMGPTDPARNGPFSHMDIALSNRAPVNHSRRAR
ncbi:MAG: glycosyltransferase family 9 protein, partial [Acidobacteriota bacterium]|nr:glycosyltransferase family 9 protein [Acidobacteriota bacterium]